MSRSVSIITPLFIDGLLFLSFFVIELLPPWVIRSGKEKVLFHPSAILTGMEHIGD